MTQRIFRQLRDPDNVTTEKGVLTGNKVKRMHFERWQDPEAREAFQVRDLPRDQTGRAAETTSAWLPSG